ncbi:MAG: FecR domain-containing protein [Leptospiraceae bacterium]|nr:FecR domain-containing protein [Leptospiraceae bacterium]MCB1304374.1 FecR domain-containing protein [Leptospiraceae bacterium]
MKKQILTTIALVSAIVLTPMALQAERAVVTTLVGYVRVQPGGTGAWKNLKVKSIINSKDKIQTGPQSRLIIFFRGMEFRLGEKTTITVETLDPKKTALVKLQEGFTWFKVKDPTKLGVDVSSPTAVASVRGTKFSVSYDDKGTATCVCEGTIATKSPGSDETQDVKKGFSRDFPADGDAQTNDFTELFRGLKVDKKFQAVIDKDAKMKNCTMCHRMTDLASDHSPDPTDY